MVCQLCGNETSDELSLCPACGLSTHPGPRKGSRPNRKKNAYLWSIVIVGSALLFLYLLRTVTLIVQASVPK